MPERQTAAKTGKRKGRGRPTHKTPEKVRLLCEMISAGAMTVDALKAIGATTSNLRDWEDNDAEFSQSLARARKLWATARAEIEGLAAMAPPRMIVGEDGTRVDPGWVSHITSRLNYMKWMMSKRDPEKFGDKSTVEHAGQIDSHIAVTALSEDKWLAMLEKKQAAIARRHSPKELGNGEQNL